METNLALHIMIEVIGQLAEEGKDYCRLSSWRKENGIPRSTFFRHLSSLKKLGVVESVGRDKYRLTGLFTDKVKLAHRQSYFPLYLKSSVK